MNGCQDMSKSMIGTSICVSASTLHCDEWEGSFEVLSAAKSFLPIPT